MGAEETVPIQHLCFGQQENARLWDGLKQWEAQEGDQEASLFTLLENSWEYRKDRNGAAPHPPPPIGDMAPLIPWKNNLRALSLTWNEH